jgi:hypothetical protein
MGSSQAPLIAAIITASVALLVGLAAAVLKWVSDQRDAWWKRAQWAIDKSLSAVPADREIGSESMAVLAHAHVGVSEADLRVLELALLRAMVDVR